RRERRPEQTFDAVVERHSREWKTRPYSMNLEEVSFGSALRKNVCVSEEEIGVARRSSMFEKVFTLRRLSRHVIHDQVGHQVFASGQVAQIAPRTQTRIGPSMVDRIETGVRSLDRVIKRQKVHAAKQAGKRSIQQRTERLKSAAG